MIVKTRGKLELCEVMVKGGKLPAPYTKAIRDALQAMEGFTVDIVIKKFCKKRTSKQNKYLQSAIYPPINELVYEMTGAPYPNNDKVADDVKKAIGWTEEQEITKWDGVTFITTTEKVPKRSNNLDTIDFQEYCHLIRKWAFEFGNLNLPDPDGVPYY